MMAGLVPMGILPDETGNVGQKTAGEVGRQREEGVEFLQSLFTASQEGGKPLYILRCKPSPLPRITLGITKLATGGKGVEGLHPTAIAVAGTHEAGSAVIVVAVEMA